MEFQYLRVEPMLCISSSDFHAGKDSLDRCLLRGVHPVTQGQGQPSVPLGTLVVVRWMKFTGGQSHVFSCSLLFAMHNHEQNLCLASLTHLCTFGIMCIDLPGPIF